MNQKSFFKKYVEFNLRDPKLQKINFDTIPKNSIFIAPLTYLTPNYLAVSMLSLLSSLSRMGYKTILFLHDTNLVSHPFSKKFAMASNRFNLEKNMHRIRKEIEQILTRFSADLKNVKVMQASDAWERTIADKTDFLHFFDYLSYIKISGERSKKNQDMHQLFEKPFDVYFAKKYLNQYANNSLQELFIITSEDRYGYYEELLRALERQMAVPANVPKFPRLVVDREIPYMDLDNDIPRCNMPKEEIYTIITNAKLNKLKRKKLIYNFILPLSEFMYATNVITKPLQKPKLNNGGTAYLCDSIYFLLKSLNTELNNWNLTKRDMIIDTRSKLKQFRGVLNSSITHRLLWYCDGKNTISDVSKLLGMQLSNTSTYIKKMQALGLITQEKLPRTTVNRIIIEGDIL